MGSIAITSYDLFILLLLTVCGIMGQDEVVDSSTSGTIACVNINQCQPIMQMFQDAGKPMNSSVEQYHQSLRCCFDANERRVWCEQQHETYETKLPPDVSNHVNLKLINSKLCGEPGPASELSQSTDLLNGGGSKTGVFDYPWMAVLGYNLKGVSDFNFRWSGTVINERYILTSAYCVYILGDYLKFVRVGEHTASTESDCIFDENGEKLLCAENYQDISVESIQRHPEYLIDHSASNIALVRLSRDIDFTPSNVKPICLPVGSAATPVTKKMTVTGWSKEENELPSDELLQIKISLVSNEVCAETYGYKTNITHKQLCGGSKTDLCVNNGYSGGPLQARARYHNTLKFVQYGIPSILSPDCTKYKDCGVYTNVIYYMDWILDNIRP